MEEEDYSNDGTRVVAHVPLPMARRLDGMGLSVRPGDSEGTSAGAGAGLGDIESGSAAAAATAGAGLGAGHGDGSSAAAAAGGWSAEDEAVLLKMMEEEGENTRDIKLV